VPVVIFQNGFYNQISSGHTIVSIIVEARSRTSVIRWGYVTREVYSGESVGGPARVREVTIESKRPKSNGGFYLYRRVGKSFSSILGPVAVCCPG